MVGAQGKRVTTNVAQWADPTCFICQKSNVSAALPGGSGQGLSHSPAKHLLSAWKCRSELVWVRGTQESMKGLAFVTLLPEQILKHKDDSS